MIGKYNQFSQEAQIEKVTWMLTSFILCIRKVFLLGVSVAHRGIWLIDIAHYKKKFVVVSGLRN